MINVLYITHEYNIILGSTHSLLNMLHTVKNEVKPTIIFPGEGIAVDYIRSFGYECIVVPFRENVIYKKHLFTRYIPRLVYDKIINKRAVNKLKKIIADRQIEIIHSNTSVILIGHRLTHICKLKHVWHLREFQDLDFNYIPFCGWRKLRQYINQTDAVIAITEAVKKHFLQADNQHSYVINDAVRSNNEICNVSKKEYLLFCGNVCETKGAETALKIFAAFRKHYPTYNFFYLGNIEDGYKNKLQKKAIQLGVIDKISFLGYRENIKEIMKEAKALLMCSRNEAQGRVTVEAMFYGAPVVGFKSGGTQEIIQDGINGYLFSTTEEAVNKLLMLCSDSGLYETLIKNAHLTASRYFSEEVYGEKIIAIYKELLKK